MAPGSPSSQQSFAPHDNSSHSSNVPDSSGQESHTMDVDYNSSDSEDPAPMEYVQYQTLISFILNFVLFFFAPNVSDMLNAAFDGNHAANVLAS